MFALNAPASAARRFRISVELMTSLGDEEKEAASSLDSELSRHADLTLRAFDAIGMAFEQAAPAARPSRLVTTTLLTRIANDLRCVALLALRGYPLQAATLVAWDRRR